MIGLLVHRTVAGTHSIEQLIERLNNSFAKDKNKSKSKTRTPHQDKQAHQAQTCYRKLLDKLKL